MLGVVGVTAMEARAAEVTVMVTVGDVNEFSVAVIFVVPALCDAAEPLSPDALLMLATAALEDVQVTSVVRFWVEFSV